ncbi:MAG: glucosamine-6-phosphate deaminase [Oscillospiraceae bacterium]|nr:glucosamine-6-phosphate deaminase [Oscillospiraceae bacterium]
MICHILKDADAIGKAAASLFVSQTLRKPDSVLGFATGSSPIPTYQGMIDAYKAGIVDFAGVTTFNLDEYCGLAPDHDQGYRYFMMQNLFDHLNVPHDRIHVPNGLAADFDAEGVAYDAAIDAAGGIDLQILGIGHNGHIGFNEPCDVFPQITHKVTLTESTIEANKRFFASADEVPRYAVSMGIGTILKVRSIVLVATGKGKAEAVKKMIKDDPSPFCPASALQFHPDVTVLLDADAASLL